MFCHDPALVGIQQITNIGLQLEVQQLEHNVKVSFRCGGKYLDTFGQRSSLVVTYLVGCLWSVQHC